jgi:tape measure domain-containing protein
MANNYQNQVNEAKAAIDAIIVKTRELDEALLKVVGNLGKVGSFKNPSGTSDELNKQGEQIKKLNLLLEKQGEQIKKLINSKQQLADKQKVTNSLTGQEVANQRLLARNNNLATQSTSALAGAYGRLSAQQKIAKQNLQNLIVSQGKNSAATKKAQSHYNSLTAKINQANKATSNFSKTGLGSAVKGLRNLIAAFGIVGGVQIFANMARNIFELTKKLDGMNFSMRKIIPSNYEFQQTLAFLKQITNDYGTEIIATTERYIKFLAAAKQSNLSLAKTEKIFGTVTKAAGVLGLKTDELTGVYLALEQMLSKGKVTTEELRRQLGERLPGAFGIMAKSVGVGVKELDKLLRAGEILSAEALPKFAEELERAYGIETVTKVDTLVAAQNRLANAWIEFVQDLNATSIFKDALNFLAENLSKILNITFKLVKGFVVYKAVVISLSLVMRGYTVVVGVLTAAKLALAAGTARATVAMRAFNLVTKLNPIGALISVLGLAAAAWIAFKDGVIETSQALRNLEKQMFEVSKTIVEQQIKILDEKTNQIKSSSKSEEEATKKSLEMLDDYEEKVIAGTATIYSSKEDLEKAILETQKENAAKQQQELDESLNTQVLSYQEAAKQIQSTGQNFRLPTPEESASRTVTAPLDNAQLEVLAEIERRRKELLKEKETLEDKAAKKRAEKIRKDKFDLEKYLLEIQIQAQEEIIENDKRSVEERLNANTKYLEKSKELIDLEKDYALGEEKITSFKIKEIKERAIQENKELTQEGLNNTKEIFQSDFDTRMEFYKKIKNAQERNLDNEISVYQNSLIEQGLSREKIEEKVNERIKKIRKEDLKDLLENEIKKLQAIAITAENRIAVEEELASLRMMLSDLNLPDDKKIDKASVALQNFFQSFQDDFFSEAGFDKLNEMFLTFDKDGKSMFQNLWKDAKTTEEKFAVAFNAITEVAQEAFNFIAQNSQAKFDMEYERLEKQKDISLQFAGESQAAKDRIEEQYEAKRKAIQRRQAKAQKQQAIVNTIFNTAQGIVSALAQVPKFDGGISATTLAAIIGGIGAAQIALIASTPVPEFFRGTMNAPEGYAKVDEKNPEVHTDRQGNVKSWGEDKGSLRYLSAGDKIYKTREMYFEKELNTVLGSNDIFPYAEMNNAMPTVVVESQGLKASDLDMIMAKHFANIQINETRIDKNGLRTFVKNQGGSTEKLNNRTNFRGFSV